MANLSTLLLVVAAFTVALAVPWWEYRVHFREQSMDGCMDYKCVDTAGASCDPVMALNQTLSCKAPLGEAMTTTGCLCKGAADFLNVGDVCSATDAKTCNPKMSSCQPTVFGQPSSERKCFGLRFMGDACATTFDCSPPRVCTGGICVGNLATGANCTVNAAPQGVCPVDNDCVGTPQLAQCMPKLAAGAACVKQTGPDIPKKCAAPLLCIDGTCKTATAFAIANGQPSQGNPFLCASGFMIGPNCAAVPDDFAAKLGTHCNTRTDCATGQECQCSTKEMGNMKACKSYFPTKATMESLINVYASLYPTVNQCESDDVSPATANDPAWCGARVGKAAEAKTVACATVDRSSFYCGTPIDELCKSAAGLAASASPLVLLALAVAAVFVARN